MLIHGHSFCTRFEWGKVTSQTQKKKSKQVFIQIKLVVTHVQNQSVTGIFFGA